MDPHPGLAAVFIQRIDSSLHPTVWRLGAPGERSRAIVLLEDGEGRIEGPGADPLPVASPSLRWLVQPAGLRLRTEAGATGYVGVFAETFLAELNAGYSDAAVLSFAADREHHLAPLSPRDADPGGILAALDRELQTPRVGSPIVVGALVRILLVVLLRLSGLDVALEGAGADARFLQHFRSLLEANFRARWPVARYAERIGISHDRLHSLCTRQLGRTPKALIDERVAREAALGLERSTLSLDQLSYSLGFRDSAQFSHFFKRVAGLSPGAYRRLAGGTAREGFAPAISSFADWP